MEFIIEAILDIILEGSIEASKNKKIPKPIRCSLLLIIVIFFLVVIGLLFYGGILILKKNICAGIFVILVDLFLFLGCTIKFKKEYLIRKNK